jgi:hypothetical protein
MYRSASTIVPITAAPPTNSSQRGLEERGISTGGGDFNVTGWPSLGAIESCNDIKNQVSCLKYKGCAQLRSRNDSCLCVQMDYYGNCVYVTCLGFFGACLSSVLSLLSFKVCLFRVIWEGGRFLGVALAAVRCCSLLSAKNNCHYLEGCAIQWANTRNHV